MNACQIQCNRNSFILPITLTTRRVQANLMKLVGFTLCNMRPRISQDNINENLAMICVLRKTALYYERFNGYKGKNVHFL